MGGVAAGTFFYICVMYTLAKGVGAKDAAGAPRCWAIWACAALLLISAAAIVAVQIYLGLLKRELSNRWTQLLDMLSDDSFGYLQDESSGDHQLLSLMTFLGALTETLAAGGGLLTVFMLGALCFPTCVKGCFRVGLLAVVAAAAALATSVYIEPDIPEHEFIFSAIVFYLTRLLARAVVPLLVMWTAVSSWGIRIGRGRHKSPPPQQPDPTENSTNTTTSDNVGTPGAHCEHAEVSGGETGSDSGGKKRRVVAC